MMNHKKLLLIISLVIAGCNSGSNNNSNSSVNPPIHESAWKVIDIPKNDYQMNWPDVTQITGFASLPYYSGLRGYNGAGTVAFNEEINLWGGIAKTPSIISVDKMVQGYIYTVITAENSTHNLWIRPNGFPWVDITPDITKRQKFNSVYVDDKGHIYATTENNIIYHCIYNMTYEQNNCDDITSNYYSSSKNSIKNITVNTNHNTIYVVTDTEVWQTKLDNIYWVKMDNSPKGGLKIMHDKFDNLFLATNSSNGGYYFDGQVWNNLQFGESQNSITIFYDEKSGEKVIFGNASNHVNVFSPKTNKKSQIISTMTFPEYSFIRTCNSGIFSVTSTPYYVYGLTTCNNGRNYVLQLNPDVLSKS